MSSRVMALPLLASLLLAQVQAANARLAQAHSQGDDQASYSGQELATLLQDVLPAWQHHVELVKTQTERAVLQLSSSFSSDVSML